MRPMMLYRAAIRYSVPPRFHHADGPLTDRSARRDDGHVETDGGVRYDDDDTAFTTYTSDSYRYRIEYPAGWTAKTDPPGGMFFSARTDGKSAFVFVDDETDDGDSLDGYVDDFFCELAADEYIHDLERQAGRTTTLPSGGSGIVVEYTYIDDASYEQWCCLYLFAIVDGTGYIVGVEWEAADEFEACAMRIIDSFALVGTIRGESNSDDHRDAADSRSSKQRTGDDQ